MNTADISWLSLILGFFLLIIPIFFFHYYDTKLNKETIIAFLRMVLQLFVVGFVLKVVFRWDNLAVNLAWIIGMLIAAALTIGRRTKLKQKYIFIPVFASVIVSSFFIGIVFALAIIGLKDLLSARYLIPIFGMIIGNTINNSVIGLRSFYNQFQTHEDRYKYLLTMGATRNEALKIFVGEALKDAFTPTIASTAVMGLVWLPGMMTGQILGGSSPVVAIKYQILIMISIIVSGVLNVVLSIKISIRYSFNEYDMLKKEIYQNQK